jgi:hypothetical protein
MAQKFRRAPQKTVIEPLSAGFARANWFFIGGAVPNAYSLNGTAATARRGRKWPGAGFSFSISSASGWDACRRYSKYSDVYQGPLECEESVMSHENVLPYEPLAFANAAVAS